jgi:hypothetical protein
MCSSTALQALNNSNRLNNGYGCQATTDTDSESQKDAKNGRGSLPAWLGFHGWNSQQPRFFKFIDVVESLPVPMRDGLCYFG